MPSALTLSKISMRRRSIVLGAALLELGHVDRLHQGLLGEQHAVFGGAADADAQHARRAPAGTHLGQHFQNPVDDRVARVHHLELRLVFAAAALGRHVDGDFVALDHVDMEHAGRVVAGVAAGEGRIGQDRGAQLVVGVEIGATNAFIDDLLQRLVGSSRQSWPHSMNTLTMPVSWHSGRWPSAHMRLLVRIWAMASLAAGPCSAL
jgi:hypothetical protein